MNLKQIVANLPKEAIERMQYAVETKTWPEGSVLSDAEYQHAMKVTLMYASIYADSDEPFTMDTITGDIRTGKEQKLAMKTRQGVINTKNID
jgi:uncharacterized protein YeaC (DUF1315 family)